MFTFVPTNAWNWKWDKLQKHEYSSGMLCEMTVLCHNGVNAWDDNTLAQCLGPIAKFTGPTQVFRGSNPAAVPSSKFHILNNDCMRPQIFLSHGRPGPLSNNMLLGTTLVSLPKDISFRPMALAGCMSVTDDIHTYTHTDRWTDHTMATCITKGELLSSSSAAASHKLGHLDQWSQLTTNRWLGGITVRASDLRSSGHGFDPRRAAIKLSRFTQPSILPG